MEEERRQQVANDSLIKAKDNVYQGNWPRAFAHFLMFLELLPDERHKYENLFEKMLRKLSTFLESKHQFEDLLKSYTEGLRYFPTNVKILNDFGSHLLRLEQPELALSYLQGAHDQDPRFLLAEKNLQTAKLNIIPRWHFRMLNDRKRNNAYRIAISNAITPRCNRVLDIGAGCGLLSYYASKCRGVQSITAIESSNTLSEIATNALHDIEVVKVINIKSTELNAVEIGYSNLLVTEIFDTGLFGEHILETLIHAWENLLDPLAKVIPHSADLFVTGISSEIILSKNKVFNKIPQLNLENVCIRQFNQEPYEAEDLQQKCVKYITNTQLAINIDFNNILQLKHICSKRDAIPPFTLKCITGGTIHAFAVWFDLHLDENVSITTNPLGDNVKCWEQAVVYLHHPVTLQQNEEIKLQLSCIADKLEIDVLERPSTCSNCFEILPEMVTFLNDVQVVEAAEDLELPSRFNERPCQILDLNPVPLFALFRAKKGFPGNYQCMSVGYSDREFLNFLWRRNGFCPLEEANPDTAITFQIFHWWEVYDKLSTNSLDVVFLNPVSQNGILCEQIFQHIPVLFGALKVDGLILPREVTLQVELIDSKYLDFCHKVEEENLLGFKVADEMNKYSILEQWQVQPQYYQRKTMCNLSTRTNVLRNGFPRSSGSYNVNVPISGTANGVLYWYKIEFSQNVCINTYKSLHYNGACFVFESPRFINSGDRITITIDQDKGLLKICDD